MTPINALWIDPETDFVESMKASLKESCTIHHTTDFNYEVPNEKIIEKMDLVLMEIKTNNNYLSEIIPALRKCKTNLPIILVTSHANKEVCISAINLGVNGIHEKHAGVAELQKIIEKHRGTEFKLRLNQERKAVYSQNKWVDLTSTEHKILESLINARRRLTRTELQSLVWPNSTISENNLDTHLTNLKRKIPELCSALNVKRGLGYYVS